MKRAGVYIRVSREDQAKDEKASLPAQEKDTQRTCEAGGYTVFSDYKDVDKYRATRGKDKGKLVDPASWRKDRPAYQQMCQDIREGKLDVVVCQSWDRLAAGSAIEPFFDAIEDSPCPVAFHSTWEGPIPEMMLGVLTYLRKDELKRKKERVMMAGRARLEKGKAYGGYNRYGYDYDDDTWTLNEEEAKWVEAIFEWYVGGVSVKEIRRRLITEKAPQKGKAKKRAWHEEVIRRVLHNEAYTGVAVVTWGGVPYEIPCPAIISKATFQKAQERLAKNEKWRDRNKKLPYLLGGLLKCGDCGNTWYCTGSRFRYDKGKRSERKTPLRFYGCKMGVNYPDECSCGKSIKASLLEETVWKAITDFFNSGETAKEKIDKRIKELQETREERQQEADRLEAKFNELQQERQWLILQARKGVITQADFEAQIAMLDNEGAELTLAFQEASADIPDDLDELWWEAWEQVVRDIKAFQDLDFEGKRKLLETLVDEIVIDPEQGTLCLHGTLERLVYFSTEKAQSLW